MDNYHCLGIPLALTDNNKCSLSTEGKNIETEQERGEKRMRKGMRKVGGGRKGRKEGRKGVRSFHNPFTSPKPFLGINEGLAIQQ